MDDQFRKPGNTVHDRNISGGKYHLLQSVAFRAEEESGQVHVFKKSDDRGRVCDIAHVAIYRPDSGDVCRMNQKKSNPQ